MWPSADRKMWTKGPPPPPPRGWATETGRDAGGNETLDDSTDAAEGAEGGWGTWLLRRIRAGVAVAVVRSCCFLTVSFPFAGTI